ncbi:hypothetical protein RB2150_00300 [Rhodobacterales bacterium HTCC2150]|nr:hypothetical protein RB2150_00300 [Rhodobacterales bacterium HTCC2150] [Rhodobacteraceae bacterium HTCC2150]
MKQKIKYKPNCTVLYKFDKKFWGIFSKMSYFAQFLHIFETFTLSNLDIGLLLLGGFYYV